MLLAERMNRYAPGRISALTLLALASTSTGAVAEEAPVLPPRSHPHGKSFSEWAAGWWRWALAQPASTSPLLDPTGAFCASGQTGKVWFLAGLFNESGEVTRSCTVPPGTMIFFPIVNTFYCAAPFDPPEQQTEEYVLEQVSSFPETVSGLGATIDGNPVDLDPYLVQSVFFEVELPEDNIFEDPDLAQYVFRPCADVGYYLMLHPLSAGQHTIHFEGSAGDFSVDVTYNLTVEP